MNFQQIRLVTYSRDKDSFGPVGDSHDLEGFCRALEDQLRK